jgi:hypothetical protein
MSKDKYSVHWDGSEDEHHGEVLAKPAGQEKGLPEHILDQHHETMMKADAIKANPHIMKHLMPHMEKKMAAMKKTMGEHEKITSIDQIKEKSKKMK